MTNAKGIGAFVRRFSHVVVNDLERSVAFYETVPVLRYLATFDVPEQDLAPRRSTARTVGALRGARRPDRRRSRERASGAVDVARADGAPMSTFLGHGYVKLAFTYPGRREQGRAADRRGHPAHEPVTVRNYLAMACSLPKGVKTQHARAGDPSKF